MIILTTATASALAATAGAHVLGRAAVSDEAATPLLAAPTEEPASGGAALGTLSKAADGHFWADAQVDGRPVKFLVDTGASTVALTPADARRLGVSLRDLVYDRPVSTANGRTQAAAVMLDRVTVAGVRVENVEALVVEDGLEVSLLGMTYLGRLSRFEASSDRLLLRR